MSRAAFARRFTALTAQPPLTYLTWWRMTIACRLLQTPDASVDVIAGRVGYSSEYAFGKAFKRELGVPPARYRRQQRATAEARGSGLHGSEVNEPRGQVCQTDHSPAHADT